MIDGIGISIIEEQHIAEKRIAMNKAVIAAKQQAYRRRPINEKQLLKSANKFGQFAKDYADAYRHAYNKDKNSLSNDALNKAYSQAKHCARRRFDNHEELGAPNLEHISKKAHNKHGEHHAFYTACYATHYNNLLRKKNKPIIPSFNMPPLTNGNTSTFSQNAALENKVLPNVQDEPIDLRNSLSSSTDKLLVNMLCELKNGNEFTPEMVINVPLPIMFSSMPAESFDSKEDNATQNEYRSSVQKLS